jgi:hypothetical protein
MLDTSVVGGDFVGHQISSQPTVNASVGVMPPVAVLSTVMIITKWSPFSPVLV